MTIIARHPLVAPFTSPFASMVNLRKSVCDGCRWKSSLPWGWLHIEEAPPVPLRSPPIGDHIGMGETCSKECFKVPRAAGSRTACRNSCT